MNIPRCAVGRKRHRFTRPHERVGGLKENPGVVGDGGSVRITEICAACDVMRVSAYWDATANRPRRRPVVTYR